MQHLTPEEVVDLADGGEDAALSHLASCDACRRQVAELRQTMMSVADVEVPEPSPLFWDHFSARVGSAVATEQIASASVGAIRWASWRFALASAACATVVLVVAVTLRLGTSPAVPGISAPASILVGAGAPPDDGVAFDDDPALTALADLISELDWNAAFEAGLGPLVGSADAIVVMLDEGERLQLQRLLEEALSRPGV